ncbi:MAG: hypothetical protein FWG67_06940 [Defluviitaleaceae bacterium]|nr:hypothetical protein [Defluviitaleaceae bacterium]
MTESLTWWIVQFALNFMDFVMMYFISHAMMKRYIRVEWFHTLLCLIYVIALAPVIYFDGHLFRIISFLLLSIMTKTIIKRAHLSDLIMIYILSLLILLFIQFPLAGGIWLADQIFNIYTPLLFLLVQFTSTVMIIILCQKLHWYKWFNAVQTHVVLKLLVCFTTLAFFIPTAILNFEYSLSYFLLLTLGLVLASFILIPAFIKLYKSVTTIISIKKLQSRLLGLWLDMENEEDIDVFKAHFKTTMREFDVELPLFNDEQNKHTTKKEDMLE